MFKFNEIIFDTWNDVFNDDQMMIKWEKKILNQASKTYGFFTLPIEEYYISYTC